MRIPFFNNTAVVDDASTAYANPGELPKEQIGIFDAESGGNLNLTGANATDKMIIGQGVASGKSPVKSHIIEKSKIAKVVTKTYEASVAQKTFVGFNGTDGSIENGAGSYLLKAVNVTQSYEPYPVMSTSYTADANKTPYEIGVELARTAALNPRFFVKVDVLAEEATAQLVTDDTGSNVTLAVTNGYDTVVATIPDAGEDVDLAAGNYIRIGSATDDEYPLYKVKAVGANNGSDEATITLDRPYAGDTDTGVAAGFTATAPASGDNAGLSLIGAVATPSSGQGIDIDVEDEVVSFRTALSEDFGSTEVRADTAPSIGTGSYLQALEIEKNSQAAEGYFYRMTPFQADKPEFFADASLTYDHVTILVETNTTANIAKSNKYVEIVLLFKQGELASASANLATFFGV